MSRTPVAVAALGLVPLFCACWSEAPSQGSAVLITLDTTRTDALGAYGATTRTPVLDRVAARGIIYDRAFTVAPLTLPAHASMLTGLYPPQHGIRDNGHAPLPASAVTVAEVAQTAGVQTAAFVAAVVLEESFGLGQGFDVYDAPTKPTVETTTHVAERGGGEVIEKALAWLRARDPERPFFLWVHLFEPHAPYEPPPDLRIAHRGDKYLAEVASVDRHLAPLVEELEGLPDPVTILVVADHGEALGEHGEDSHGYFVYQPTISVPLIIAHPDRRRAGERSDAVVSVIDVAPTLADALGLSLGSNSVGVTLASEDPPPERRIYFESYAGYLSFGWTPIVGCLQGRRVYLHSSEPELYDLENDPGETQDLSDDSGDIDRFLPWLTLIGSMPPLEQAGEDDVDEALLEGIRSLGYAAAGIPGGELPAPDLEPFVGYSPHARAEELRRTLLATDHFNQGRLAQALEAFDGLYTENPRSLRALGGRINCLLALGRNGEALEPLEEYLRRVPGRASEHYNLGVCLKDAGRLEEAIESFGNALRRMEEAPAWFGTFLALLQERGRTDEVQEWRRRFGRSL